jgi:hypothetical protein
MIVRMQLTPQIPLSMVEEGELDYLRRTLDPSEARFYQALAEFEIQKLPWHPYVRSPHPGSGLYLITKTKQKTDHGDATHASVVSQVVESCASSAFPMTYPTTLTYVLHAWIQHPPSDFSLMMFLMLF